MGFEVTTIAGEEHEGDMGYVAPRDIILAPDGHVLGPDEPQTGRLIARKGQRVSDRTVQRYLTDEVKAALAEAPEPDPEEVAAEEAKAAEEPEPEPEPEPEAEVPPAEEPPADAPTEDPKPEAKPKAKAAAQRKPRG